MSDAPDTDNDDWLAHRQAMKDEADQLLEDPGINTPTDPGPPDENQDLPAG